MNDRRYNPKQEAQDEFEARVDAAHDLRKDRREFWAVHFPKTPKEASTWEPYRTRRALATHVLVVAKTRVEGAWAAYIGDVPGVSHRFEWQLVEKQGTKLSERVARAIFPEFEGVPYAK